MENSISVNSRKMGFTAVSSVQRGGFQARRRREQHPWTVASAGPPDDPEDPDEPEAPDDDSWSEPDRPEEEEEQLSGAEPPPEISTDEAAPSAPHRDSSSIAQVQNSQPSRGSRFLDPSVERSRSRTRTAEEQDREAEPVATTVSSHQIIGHIETRIFLDGRKV